MVQINVNKNELSSALLDMYDIRKALPAKVLRMPKDTDGSTIPISWCVDDVIEFLEKLEGEMQ